MGISSENIQGLALFVNEYGKQGNNLVKAIKDLDNSDGKLDGEVRGVSIFDTKNQKGADLQNSYMSMLNSEKGNDAILTLKNHDDFVLKFLDADAQDDQAYNGSVLNNSLLKQKDTKDLTGNIYNVMKSEFFSILASYDKSDGKVDGSLNASVSSLLGVSRDSQKWIDEYISSNKSSGLEDVINNSTAVRETPAQAVDENGEVQSESSKNTDKSEKSRKEEDKNDIFNRDLDDEDSQDTINELILHKLNKKIANKTAQTGKSEEPVSNPTDLSSLKGNTEVGKLIANAAHNVIGSNGWCYKGVINSLTNAGVIKPGELTGRSAYMAADQLANNSKFKEVSVSQNDLKSLPAGAIVVWSNTAQNPHGHISIALGDGRESSDHIQSQMTSLRGSSTYRVFMPVA